MDSPSKGDQPSKKQKTRNGTTIDFSSDSIVKYLPDHLMYEILLRSPAESLIRFKSVCKDWNSLIKDRKFVIRYYDHHKGNDDSKGIVLMSATTEFPEGYNLANFNNFFGYENNVCNARKQAEEKLELTLHTDLEMPLCLTTCNGLVCFYREFPVLMWNPITKEFIMLSKPKFEEKEEYQSACGFGYNAANNEYKVVQLLNRLSDSSLECMVLNLGTNTSWRRLQRQHNRLHPNLMFEDSISEPVFTDGSIYWLTHGDILCFDVSAETFKEIPTPAPVKMECHHLQQRFEGPIDCTMVELDKSVCFTILYIRGRMMDIWMMQKDCADIKNLWVKGYTIDLDCIFNSNLPRAPVCIRSKKIYVACDNGLACYDTDTKDFEMLFNKVPDIYDFGVAYTKSIVCLKDIVGSKCVSTVHNGKCEECRQFWHVRPRI